MPSKIQTFIPSFHTISLIKNGSYICNQYTYLGLLLLVHPMPQKLQRCSKIFRRNHCRFHRLRQSGGTLFFSTYVIDLALRQRNQRGHYQSSRWYGTSFQIITASKKYDEISMTCSRLTKVSFPMTTFQRVCANPSKQIPLLLSTLPPVSSKV